MVVALQAQSVTQAEAMQRASRYYNQHVRPVHTQLQIENNTHVEYVVPSMELLPGTKIELGSTLDIQIAPVYQFCNTQGPGNTAVK